jgi:hypothetical protein
VLPKVTHITMFFTFSAGYTNMHIMKECFKSFRVTFGLQKYSLFTQKFGSLIGRLQENSCQIEAELSL